MPFGSVQEGFKCFPIPGGYLTPFPGTYEVQRTLSASICARLVRLAQSARSLNFAEGCPGVLRSFDRQPV